jgi:cell division protein FtsQ
MDGARRLLRPLKEVIGGIQPSFPAFAGVPTGVSIEPAGLRPREGIHARRPGYRRSVSSRLKGFVTASGFGSSLVVAFFLGTGIYGSVIGGQYGELVAKEGALPDIVAKCVGFGLDAVTISGERELTEKEILDAAKIGPRNSLLFLDVTQVRRSLEAMPLVKSASVSKLYPSRILIEVEERRPFALWQKEGQVQIVATDGMPIDDLHNARFAALPLVVGDGANERLDEYVSLLDAAGDLRSRIRAGMLIAKRRWTLKMTNGVEVALPEINPQAAVAQLAQLQREAKVLDKDILSLDLRVRGRLVARMSEEAAHARAELFAHKPKVKGGQT